MKQDCPNANAASGGTDWMETDRPMLGGMSIVAAVDRIADYLNAQQKRGLMVGVDGVDGVGKTTFADDLGGALRAQGREVIRSSADGFHHTRSVRYRLGRSSPEGFYRHSYNYPLLHRVLLQPLMAQGSRLIRPAAFDHVTDKPIEAEERIASNDAILVFDGLFLHRPELRGYWDFTVFLDAPFEVTISRGASRGPGFGDPDPKATSNRRYIEGNRLYFNECKPRQIASVVVDHSDLARSHIIAWND
ncbi:uridine kinase [Methylobacterium sp. NMS14P]|uniref:uridine kinase n=1 Tax=Methylobacterium sp. NMS14P TaxID=2894310 RepID=UPI002359A3F0|nr:uridine kinase [Methylobacterium sp. NMS14P]WCS23806.1 uridine kinase [Methylobacterium sp. NMS14P]